MSTGVAMRSKEPWVSAIGTPLRSRMTPRGARTTRIRILLFSDNVRKYSYFTTWSQYSRPRRRKNSPNPIHWRMRILDTIQGSCSRFRMRPLIPGSAATGRRGPRKGRRREATSRRSGPSPPLPRGRKTDALPPEPAGGSRRRTRPREAPRRSGGGRSRSEGRCGGRSRARRNRPPSRREETSRAARRSKSRGRAREKGRPGIRAGRRETARHRRSPGTRNRAGGTTGRTRRAARRSPRSPRTTAQAAREGVSRRPLPERDGRTGEDDQDLLHGQEVHRARHPDVQEEPLAGAVDAHDGPEQGPLRHAPVEPGEEDPVSRHHILGRGNVFQAAEVSSHPLGDRPNAVALDDHIRGEAAVRHEDDFREARIGPVNASDGAVGDDDRHPRYHALSGPRIDEDPLEPGGDVVPDDAGADRARLQGLRESQQILETPVLQRRIAALLELVPQHCHFLPEFPVFPGDVHQSDIPRPQGGDPLPEKIDPSIDRPEQVRPDPSDQLVLEKSGGADEELDGRRQKSGHEEESPPRSE